MGLAVALVSLAMVGPATAQTNFPSFPGAMRAPAAAAATPAAAAAPAVPAPAAAALAPAASAPAERNIELKFDGADVKVVLAWYGQKTGRTLLQAPDIKGTVTLRSQTPLTLKEALEALDAVLAMNNITMQKVGEKFLKVLPIGSARQEGIPIRTGAETPVGDTDALISEIVRVEHIDLGDAQKVISSLVHAYGKVQPLELINAMLITDTAANLNRIREILTHVDQPAELREEMRIITIRHTKASEIKKKIEEIIAESQAGKAEATVPRQRSSGGPGVDARTVVQPTPIGVIRPPTTAAPVAREVEETMSKAERGIFQGKVKIVADDRTGILIILTKPENMPFFENIVKALDVVTDPDVMVKVFRLEYSEAEGVAKILNDLIGAASPKKEEAPAATAATAGQTPSPESPAEARSAALQDYIRRQTEATAASKTTTPEKSKIGELSATSIKILSDKRTNALIIMASKSDMETIEEIITAMDIMLSQVLVEAVILQVDLRNQSDTGLKWVQRSMIAFDRKSDMTRKPLFAFAGSSGSGAASSGPNPADATALNASGSLAPLGGLTYYFTHFGLNLDAVIRMSANDSRSRVLSSPAVFTTDNKKAEIDVSTELYVYKGQTPTSVGGTIAYVPNVELRKIGINLTVTPHINPKGFVSMEIAQKIEDQAGTQTITGQGDYPTFSSRSLTASVAVKSGETIVLGGLVSNRKVTSRSKIPILGDIPLVGLAFGSRSGDAERQEVIVFITPYVLDKVEEIAADAKRRKDSVHAKGLWERGWSNSKLSDPTPEQRAEEEAAAEAIAATNTPAGRRAKPDVSSLDEIRQLETQPAPRPGKGVVP